MQRELHYPGNHPDIAGQIVGPTLLGQLLCIIHTEYDGEKDRTTAFVRPATIPELQAAGYGVSA